MLLLILSVDVDIVVFSFFLFFCAPRLCRRWPPLRANTLAIIVELLFALLCVAFHWLDFVRLPSPRALPRNTYVQTYRGLEWSRESANEYQKKKYRKRKKKKKKTRNSPWYFSSFVRKCKQKGTCFTPQQCFFFQSSLFVLCVIYAHRHFISNE